MFSFTPCNTYAPNGNKRKVKKNSRGFFRDISNYLNDFQCDKVITAADFKLNMDIKKIVRDGGAPAENKQEEL